MNICSKLLFSVMVTTGSLCQLAIAKSNIAAETLTYNRDLWVESPKQAAKKSPHIHWKGLKSNHADLTLWEQPITGVSLIGDGKTTQNLCYTIYDSTQLNSRESHQIITRWKSLLTQKSGKPARSLSALRLGSGANQTRTIWDAADCTILLSSTKQDGRQAIKVSFLRKDYAKAALSISDPDVVTDRTFYSNDYRKSFIGRLNSYDEEKKVAKIQIKSQVTPISMDLLSAEDQDYVKKMGPYTAVYRGLAFSFKEVKSKPEKKGQLSITDLNYNLTIRNNASTQMENVKIQYYIYYYIGDVKKAGSVLTRTSGSKTLRIYPKMTDFIATNKLELVKNIVRGQAGG